MIYPSKQQFVKLAKKGNLIPVYKEVPADLETPVSAFLKIDAGDYSYLLESVEGTEKVARYSFLGSNPSLVFRSKGRNITITESGKARSFKTKTDPLDEIRKVMKRYKFVPVEGLPAAYGAWQAGLPRFCGGLVGYMGYDVVRFFEKLPDENKDDLGLPDTIFALTDTILLFDHIMHMIKVVSNAYVRGDPAEAYDEAAAKIEGIAERLDRPAPHMPLIGGRRERLPVSSNLTQANFEKKVIKAKEYIRAGDIIQVVLSQRFEAPLDGKEPFSIYRNLRSINPSPYMFYLKLADLRLIGASPEIMVRCEDGIIELRPIAGTRRRGKTDAEDKKLAAELLKDPKEIAEHIMLVDLGRNDVGRVADFDSVKISELMAIERYSHVMHIVSDVQGKLSKGKDIYDVVRATFPAGTVTGAPKIRAMEIIDELENMKRGQYAGCVGYFSFSGNLDTCITIRTILVKGNKAYVQAGAGIVADSDPGREFKETVNKAKAMIRAIEET